MAKALYDLPISIEKAAARYKPIEMDGLTLYPVLTKEYESFLAARGAIEVMHQSLPVAMMRIPLLAALYRMDYEALLNGTPPCGLFSSAILALALSLRLGEGLAKEDRLRLISILVDRDDASKLRGVSFTDSDGKERTITPQQYATLRKIIAVQNGVKLESDTANPDLVKAEKNMAAANAVELDANIEDMISAVAALCGESEEEIDEWPILKLQRRAESYRRMIDYLVCGFGEMNGTTWKGGNPNPHPFFKRSQNGSRVLSALGSVDGKTPPPPQAARELAKQTKDL